MAHEGYLSNIPQGPEATEKNYFEQYTLLKADGSVPAFAGAWEDAKPTWASIVRRGNEVTLYVRGVTGTASGSGTAALTAIPARFRPSVDVFGTAAITINATQSLGLATLAAATGIVTVSTAAGGNFGATNAANINTFEMRWYISMPAPA